MDLQKILKKTASKLASKTMLFPEELELLVATHPYNSVMKDQLISYSNNKLYLNPHAIEGKGLVASMEYARHKKLALNQKINWQRKLRLMELKPSDYKGLLRFSMLQMMCPAPITMVSPKEETSSVKVVRPKNPNNMERLFNLKEPDVDHSREGYLETLIAKGFAYSIFDSKFELGIRFALEEAAKENKNSSRDVSNQLKGIREAFGCFVRDMYTGFETLFEDDISLYGKNFINTSDLQFYYNQLYNELELEMKKSQKIPGIRQEMIQYSSQKEKLSAIIALPEIVEAYAKEEKFLGLTSMHSVIESLSEIQDNNIKERCRITKPEKDINYDEVQNAIENSKLIN